MKEVITQKIGLVIKPVNLKGNIFFSQIFGYYRFNLFLLYNIKYQDYIKEPNFNGYRSLHLDIEVSVFLSDHIEKVIVEIQIRTVAQDFWASLEHDIRYKSDKYIPQDICDDMLQSANEIAAIDLKMQQTFKKIQNI